VLYLSVFQPTILPRAPANRRKPISQCQMAPLMWLCPLQGTTHLARHAFTPFCSRKQKQRLLSWSSLAPPTPEPERIHSTPVCLTGYVPPTGFLTLSTGYSSLRRLALFHASSAHGVLSLSRDFPLLLGPAGSSPRNGPLDVLLRRPAISIKIWRCARL
jgi:hypothetical protein